MNLIFSFIGGLLGKLVAPLLAYYKGKTDAKNEQLQRDAKASLAEAERHANAPRTTHATAHFLFDRSARKRLHEANNKR